ncbi:MAG: hypothetical protein LBL92_07115 [Propionibacteriaceae bacterium]|jgi:hypothetical protein|nr:hypothetical protein [Propionibacteriaceae bacterium]
MQTLTVDLTPSQAAALVRWHLSCGDDRFFEATDDFGTNDNATVYDTGCDAPVILLQTARVLPRSGLSGCSILISNLTGVTRVAFATVDDGSWLTAPTRERLRHKLLTAFEAHLLPDPVGPSTADLIAQAKALTTPIADRDATVAADLAEANTELTAATLAAPLAADQLATADASPETELEPIAAPWWHNSGPQPHPSPLEPDGLSDADFFDLMAGVFDVTLELAELMANDVRTADDRPDPYGPGPITEIEALTADEVDALRQASGPVR